MLKHSAHLFEGDAWEPVDKLRRHGAAFEVFEQCCNGYSGTSKHPCSAHAIRVPLDCGAGRPIDHGRTASTVATTAFFVQEAYRPPAGQICVEINSAWGA